jgi:hypothetical protein
MYQASTWGIPPVLQLAEFMAPETSAFLYKN